jgi:hypothetical protein
MRRVATLERSEVQASLRDAIRLTQFRGLKPTASLERRSATVIAVSRKKFHEVAASASESNAFRSTRWRS